MTEFLKLFENIDPDYVLIECVHVHSDDSESVSHSISLSDLIEDLDGKAITTDAV